MKSTKSIFHEWLQQEVSSRGYLFHYACLKTRHINKIKTELFVINSEAGDPLCIFEVQKDSDLSSEHKGFFLSKLPTWCLNLPGYAVLFRQSKGNIITFRVRKFTPRERLVGDFSPREFAGFMAATINFCRKKNGKEN